MVAGVLEAIGGLGMFLLGMTVMTGALKALADQRMRSMLVRAVDSPVKGAVTGALSTALLQSSSATTVAAVGFVGAGLLTFSESLGIIFGANIGTTITGWLVAFIGFKLNLGQMMLPLIFLGVMLRLSGRPRLDHVGMAIAGFGLVFVGIGILQSGMSGLEGRVTPEHFPPDTLWGRLLLVLLGVLVTIITQSSSAGVATALTAVHTQTITLNQAAALVIGMDVGTTATAVLATIGGNVQARRTGYAHFIYNSFTAVGAFLLLSPYMHAVEAIWPAATKSDPEFVLVGFHSFFNALGVFAILPFTRRFADFLLRLVPDRGNPLVRPLDRSLLTDPAVAVDAVGNTLRQIAQSLFGELHSLMKNAAPTGDVRKMEDVTEALDKCKEFLQEIAASVQGAERINDYVAHLHVLDHLRRIATRVREERRLKRCRDDARLASMADSVASASAALIAADQPMTQEELRRIHDLNRELKAALREYRLNTLRETTGTLETSTALRRIDTARSLRRIAYHIWRIGWHFAGGASVAENLDESLDDAHRDASQPSASKHREDRGG